MPVKTEVTLQFIPNPALEGGSPSTTSCGLSTFGKEPLTILLVAEWASWPFWKASITSQHGIRLPDLHVIPTAWRML